MAEIPVDLPEEAGERIPTPLQIERNVRAARDSVWVIEDTLAKLAAGAPPTEELLGNLERNVGHLQHTVDDEHVINSGLNIADLHVGISSGNAKLNESIWDTVKAQIEERKNNPDL